MEDALGVGRGLRDRIFIDREYHKPIGLGYDLKINC